MALEPGQRDRGVGDGNLPGADHLVAADQPAHGPVADADQEGLVRDGRQPQQALQRLRRVDSRRVETVAGPGGARHVAGHARWLAQQHVDGDVHRIVAVKGIVHLQDAVIGRAADDRIGAAFAAAQRLEGRDPRRRDGQHVAFLGLVAPDFQRRHARLVVRHRAQVDPAAAMAVRHRLRHRVRQPAGADVVDQQDRAVGSHRGTAVDDLLGAALHLRVAALHRGEIEVGRAGAAADRRGRAAAEADEHGRPAEHDDAGPGRDLALLHVPATERAETARNHDRLVIAADRPVRVRRELLLEAAEIPQDVGTPELVVEGGGADRRLQHDLQRRGDPRRAAVVDLPRLPATGNAQVRDRVAD